jgi:hypothetical protein
MEGPAEKLCTLLMLNVKYGASLEGYLRYSNRFECTVYEEMVVTGMPVCPSQYTGIGHGAG